jgi:multicomponent Na+:H+ antiporter subunit B
MIDVLIVVLMAFLILLALAVVRIRDLFAATMLMGIFSLLSAGWFTVMDAVDVAFTEAAVGAGISTVLFLSTLALVSETEETIPKQAPMLGLCVVLLTGGALFYSTLDMPHFGVSDAPIHQHVAPEYMADAVPVEETGEPLYIGIPNIVTTVLASYRGYDTLGETTVIFTGATAVLMLLGSRRRKRRREKPLK